MLIWAQIKQLRINWFGMNAKGLLQNVMFMRSRSFIKYGYTKRIKEQIKEGIF
jgi:hypothetical protein